MKLHPEELALAQAYTQALPFEGLTDSQLKSIMDRGRELYRWYRAHLAFHTAISVAVIAFILGADYWAILRLPRWFLPAGGEHSTGMILLAASLSGALHSYLLYSLGIYTMHEGSAHHAIFPPQGAISRGADWLATHLGRISGADPNHYTAHHMSHHAKFGTAEDGEFLNFVLPKRYWPTLAPLAVMFNYSDFIAHRPEIFTRSRIITVTCAVLYSGTYAYFAYQAFGLLFTAVAMGIFLPHVGFYIDRMRQLTEHNMMPLENKNGARSFGLGFWGMFLGGGPWGSPCHWEHHLVASIPWYQQLILHVHVRRLLTPRQKEFFLLEPIIGWPKLYWRVIREPATVERTAQKAAGVSA